MQSHPAVYHARITGKRIIRVERPRSVSLIACTCLLALLALAVRPSLLVSWNMSASAPLGLYTIAARAHVSRNDYVAAWPPARFRLLAADRHYLPLHVPLIKRVGAIAGDRVCAAGGEIAINNAVVTTRRTLDGAQRALPWWWGCQTLVGGQVFLLSRKADAFDGRYFGVSNAGDILGRATPWLR